MDWIKVSIIIPVYNVEAYIIECLKSVASQTFQGKMECILVDDCGTDKSILIAKEFIQSYTGNISFVIIAHDHNRGLSAARNTGVEIASGNYIYFLDSDDAVIPETIEMMTAIVQKHPQVEMVQGGIVNMKGHVMVDFSTKDLPDYTDNRTWIVENMLLNLPISSWNRLLKTDFIKKENIYFHEGIIHEDVPYNYNLSLKCRYIGFVRNNTYLFRSQREGSITNTPQVERALLSRFAIMRDCMEVYCLCHFSNSEACHYAIRTLWKKWMVYMTIHSYEILDKHKKEIIEISNQLSAATPWKWKFFAYIYTTIPLKIKHHRFFQILSNQC